MVQYGSSSLGISDKNKVLYPRPQKEGKARGTEFPVQPKRVRATMRSGGAYGRWILRPSARQTRRCHRAEVRGKEVS